MGWKIPLFKIYWDEEDIKSVNEVIRKGAYWAMGKEIQEFEDAISEYIGTKYALTFNSGTSALHALLLAYGIKSGDEVIVPSFTFVSTANAPLFVNAKPVFAEIEDKTFGLDPEDVKERITSKTRVIIPVHYAGGPCLIEELKEIAEDHNLLLLEDAAESFGAKSNGKFVATFGDSSMLSFCQNKVITTGEGGAIVTDSREIYEKLKLIRSHGRSDLGNYFDSADVMNIVDLGYNFRMSTLTSAVGLSQMRKLDQVIKRRRAIAESIGHKLSDISGIIKPLPPEGHLHIYQMYTIRVKVSIRDGLINHLSKKGIMTKIYFPPIHLTKFYAGKFGYRQGDLPATEVISNSVLSLPIYPTLTDEEIDYVASEIHNYMEN